MHALNDRFNVDRRDGRLRQDQAGHRTDKGAEMTALACAIGLPMVLVLGTALVMEACWIIEEWKR